jgi:hypothetical protein
MTELGRGLKGGVECGDNGEPDGGRALQMVSSDGEVLVRGGDGVIGRERHIPCSARNLAKIWSARWRAASVWSGVEAGTGVGGAGFGGLGA